MRKIVGTVDAMHQRNIVHRDLHQQNLMVYFPDLMPKDQDIKDPDSYLQGLRARIVEKTKTVPIEEYGIKIIDYGFGKVFQKGQARKFNIERLGDERICAPEVEENDNYELDL